MWNASAQDGLSVDPPALATSTSCPTCGDDLRYYGFPFSCYVCRECGAYWPLQHALEARSGILDDSAGECRRAQNEVVTVLQPRPRIVSWSGDLLR